MMFSSEISYSIELITLSYKNMDYKDHILYINKLPLDKHTPNYC